MELVNRSAEPPWVLRGWLPHGLDAERVVFLPDACPGRSPLPTGTAVLTRQPGWRRFAVSDCGCGMRLLASALPPAALTREAWEAVAARLRASAGGLGDLGGGNHFLDALAPLDGGPLHFLCHTGSRAESGLVDHLVDQPAAFDREFARVTGWARDNRAAVQASLEAVVGPLTALLDAPHNGHEPLPGGGAIIRKGAVRLRPGERAVIPSHLDGEVALVRATAGVAPLLDSMSHGTGRAASRGDAKVLGEALDVADLRRRVLIPAAVSDSALRGEGPHAYRDLDACLALVADAVAVERRFRVVAYLGRL